MGLPNLMRRPTLLERRPCGAHLPKSTDRFGSERPLPACFLRHSLPAEGALNDGRHDIDA